MASRIAVSTVEYQEAHEGRKPQEDPRGKMKVWAFEIDGKEPPVFIQGAYSKALAKAKQLAQHSITVLP